MGWTCLPIRRRKEPGPATARGDYNPAFPTRLPGGASRWPSKEILLAIHKGISPLRGDRRPCCVSKL